ncbi:hypothetical protein ACFLTM_04305 [Candidatus Bipolaricaulota bacterium]
MRTRNLVSVLSVILFACGAVWAQNEEVIELEPDYLFNGLSGSIWHVDLAGLNVALEDAGYSSLPSFVPLYGQDSAFGSIDGARYGFSVDYGSISSHLGERRAELRFTLGAGVVEFGTSSGPASSIAFGLSFGAGFSVLTLVDHLPATFEDALMTPFRARLERWLYTIEPFLSAQGTPFDWLDLDLRIGWLLAFGCRWVADGAGLEFPSEVLGGAIAKASFQIHLETLIAEPTSEEEAEPDE